MQRADEEIAVRTISFRRVFIRGAAIPSSITAHRELSPLIRSFMSNIDRPEPAMPDRSRLLSRPGEFSGSHKV